MRKLTLSEKLTLLGAMQRSCKAVQRRLDMADRARDAMLAANACDPYNGVAHDRYMACSKVLWLHLSSLFGKELAEQVIERIHDDGERPSRVIKWMAAEINNQGGSK